MSLTDAHVSSIVRAPSSQRLLVSRQDPSGGRYRPLGFLEARPGADDMTEYSFTYLRRAVEEEGFRPFLGFRQVRRYTSRGLFPLFAERLLDPRRPDRPEFLAALALDEEAGPLTVLGRSGGQRNGDAIELSPVPVADADGRTQCIFLAHGVRHLAGAEDRISTLVQGDQLHLRDDARNPVNPDALHVAIADAAGSEVGWVPDVFLTYVRQLNQPELRAHRVNRADVGSRLRLLLRLEGTTTPHWSPFEGEGWETVD